MKISTIASFVTIVVGIITMVQYCNPGVKEKSPLIPDYIKSKQEGIVINIDKEIYKGERNWLLTMYKAAKDIPYSTDRSEALKKVVRTALTINDFNIAIIAAGDIPYSTDRSEILIEIVRRSLVDMNNVGYGLLASKKIPYSTDRSEAIKLIINASEKEVISKQSIDNSSTKMKSDNNAKRAK